MVTLTADNQSRVKLPGTKPGDVFTYEVSGTTVKLTPLMPGESADQPANFKLILKDGRPVIQTDRVVSPERIKELLAELP